MTTFRFATTSARGCEWNSRWSHLFKAVLLQTDDVQVKVCAQTGCLVERKSARQTVPVRLKDNTGHCHRAHTQTHAIHSTLFITQSRITVGFGTWQKPRARVPFNRREPGARPWKSILRVTHDLHFCFLCKTKINTYPPALKFTGNKLLPQSEQEKH